jgi:hypothetical protein
VWTSNVSLGKDELISLVPLRDTSRTSREALANFQSVQTLLKL